MFLLQKPSDEEIRDFIAGQSRLSFSYEAIGATKNHAAPGNYPINCLRKEIGKGQKIYTKAADALFSWQMYATNWTKLYPLNSPVEEGKVVAVLAKHFAFWSLNPCRVIYLLKEETNGFQRKGFAFGTLPAHSEKGEEQFSVEWDKSSDRVWYELYAFAKAQNWLAKIGFPLVGLLQRRFAEDSFQAMLNAVKD